MESSYWAGVLQSRWSRRRTLAVSSAAAAGALLLAACGGGKENKSGAADKSGMITAPVDTTKRAKQGGSVKWFVGNEPAHLDVQMDQVSMNQHKNMAYGHFVNEKAGYLKSPAYEEYVPEMMESWEFSPDRLQLTFKLRQGVKWHNKPPVNGRSLDVEDVVFSWDRYAAKGTDRSFLSNAANPNAPVLSLTAPDSRTIVMKLQEPIVFLLAALTPAQTGKPNIIPKETDSTFDIRKDIIGTGPFMLSKYTPTVGFTYKKNPDYFDKGWPIVDEVEVPILLEYSSALAQLKAGNIYTYASGTSAVRATDVLSVKNDIPALKMYVNEPSAFNVTSLVFGSQPAGKNPLADVRVRQALSMSWDRDAWIDTFSNVGKLEAAGLPIKTYWNTQLSAGAGSWWLDPRGKEFGPNARYFQHDPAEAKKLLAAAGFGSGLDVTSSYIGGPQLGADFQRRVEVRDEFAKDAGFRPKSHVIDYISEYVPVYRDGNGKYEGWLYRAGGSPANDAAAYFSTLYHSRYGGPGFLGFDAAGKGDQSGDPELESLLNKARIEPDLNKRRTLVFDMQRYLTKVAYSVPDPGVSTTFLLAWPVLQNFQVYQGDRRGGSGAAPHTWWLDDSQEPLKKA